MGGIAVRGIGECDNTGNREEARGRCCASVQQYDCTKYEIAASRSHRPLARSAGSAPRTHGCAPFCLFLSPHTPTKSRVVVTHAAASLTKQVELNPAS